MKHGFEMLVIASGGACGALLRYGLAITTQQWQGSGLPIGTFIANILGCFLIGFMIGSGKDQESEVLRLGFGIGFLGSLTTFSTFSAETLAFVSGGNWKLAAANAILNVLFCLLATAAGIALGRRLFP